MVKVVAFTRTLSDPGKHGQSGVLLGDVVDEFEHGDRLTHAGAAEQRDLAALRKGTYEVDHLDTGFQQLDGRTELVELRCGLMNAPSFFGHYVTNLVDGATQYIHDPSQRAATHGY